MRLACHRYQGSPPGRQVKTVQVIDARVLSRASGTFSQTYLTGVSFPDASNGWAVGIVGAILHTSNGGANWAKQTSGFTAPSSAWSSRTPATAGPWASVARSCTPATAGPPGPARPAARPSNSTACSSPTPTPAGRWAIRHDPAHQQRRDLPGPGQTNGFSGTAGELSAWRSRRQHRLGGGLRRDPHTSNGGTTWAAQTSGTTPAELKRRGVPDASTGWAVGVGGTILTPATAAPTGPSRPILTPTFSTSSAWASCRRLHRRRPRCPSQVRGAVGHGPARGAGLRPPLAPPACADGPASCKRHQLVGSLPTWSSSPAWLGRSPVQASTWPPPHKSSGVVLAAGAVLWVPLLAAGLAGAAGVAVAAHAFAGGASGGGLIVAAEGAMHFLFPRDPLSVVLQHLGERAGPRTRPRPSRFGEGCLRPQPHSAAREPANRREESH